MERSIFVKDMKNEWQGPFTECQTVDSGKNSDELEEKKEFSLATLISLNGIGCPFVDFHAAVRPDQHACEAGKEEKLERIEKEFSKLRVQCETAFDVEKRLKELEMRKKEPAIACEEPKTVLITRYKEEPFPKKIGRIGDQAMEAYWELADDLTPYVMHALHLYANGEYSNWNKERSRAMVAMLIQLNAMQQVDTMGARNTVVTYHLFEEMKLRDFFCCFFCKAVFFNYKQILIHLGSEAHMANESQAVFMSRLPNVREVIKFVTTAPFQWSYGDTRAEKERLIKYGKAGSTGDEVRPSSNFMDKFRAKYDHLIKNDSSYDFSISIRVRLIMQNVKGPMGRQAMIELDEHIGDGKTACLGCGMNTGGREEFYAHLISSVHMSSNLFDLITILVNVYRKDLV